MLTMIITGAVTTACAARVWAMQNTALPACIASSKIRIGEKQPPLVEGLNSGFCNDSLHENPVETERGHRTLLSAGGRRRIQLPDGEEKPADEDGDGVSDEHDLCPRTPSSMKVGPSGCPADTDSDGIYDAFDRCPGTPAGITVNANGCPQDTDADGVPDMADVCPGTPREIPVDRKGCPADSDQDGVYDHLDDCPKTPSSVSVDTRGCPVDSDLDGVPDYLDACPDTPRGASINERGCWVITGAHFDPGKWQIKQGLYPLLDEIVTILKGNPSLRVEIQGHTDNTGSEAHNLVLSHRRACAVMDYLVSKGVDSTRLFAGGYGSSKPVASNKTIHGRAKNRRVELVPIP